jgi:hypothetical protein
MNETGGNMDKAIMAAITTLSARSNALVSKCGNEGEYGICAAVRCENPVVEFEGRFYIRLGHRNFNSRTNNRDGYASRAAALYATRPR